MFCKNAKMSFSRHFSSTVVIMFTTIISIPLEQASDPNLWHLRSGVCLAIVCFKWY